MNYVYSFALVALVWCAGMPVSAEALEVGQTAPSFEVSYDSSKVLRSAELAGSVIVITCESRESKDLNTPFKDALLKAFSPEERLRRKISLVPVIDCFAYSWPIKGFCVRGVQAEARKLNLQLYVDMTGKIFADYGAASDTSTVVVIDREGFVRYVMAGKIPEADVACVVELVRTLALQAQK
jgi:predicted transcriptional regulator